MANRSSNTTAVPEAKSALDRFKMEVAGELGVPLTDGYNGNLTSRQNGSVGGYMVKKMIEAQERQMSGQNSMGSQSGMSGSQIQGSTIGLWMGVPSASTHQNHSDPSLGSIRYVLMYSQTSSVA